MRSKLHTAGACPLREAPRAGAAGFTLVELLVVITLFLVLAGLVLLFLPNVQEAQRAALGGTQVQGALQMARSRAVRDQAPRGVRLLPDASGKYVTSIQFTEQPDDFTVNTSQAGGDLTSTGATVTVAGLDLTNTSNDVTKPELWSVLPGDYLVVLESGQPHQIGAVNFDGTNSVLTLASAPTPDIATATRSYRIIRRPRLTGEEPILLPDAIVIDLSTNATYSSLAGQTNADKSVDIVFAPSGQVIVPAAGTQFLALWVRDSTNDDGNVPAQYYAGEPSIIAVFTNSGQVAAYDPSQSGALTDPYAFIRSGRSAGK